VTALKLHKQNHDGRFKSAVVIASGNYRNTDHPPVDIDTHGAACLRVNTNVTAISGGGATVAVLIEGLDADGETTYTLLSKAITALGLTAQLVGLTVADVSGLAKNAPLPAVVRVTCTGSGTRSALTYAVSAEVS